MQLSYSPKSGCESCPKIRMHPYPQPQVLDLWHEPLARRSKPDIHLDDDMGSTA